PGDAGRVFKAFAGFLTGLERSGQSPAASRAPAAGAQAQALHLLVDDRNLVLGTSARPFVPPAATSSAWRESDTSSFQVGLARRDHPQVRHAASPAAVG